MDVRAHVFVSGRVRGVFFRDYTSHRARPLGVSGWVRNLPDGRVEAVFEGLSEAVDKAIEAVRKGSPSSRVDNVEVDWEEPKGEQGFGIRA